MEERLAALNAKALLPGDRLLNDLHGFVRFVATNRDLFSGQRPHAGAGEPDLLALALQSISSQSNRNSSDREHPLELRQILEAAIQLGAVVDPRHEHQLGVKIDACALEPGKVLKHLC